MSQLERLWLGEEIAPAERRRIVGVHRGIVAVYVGLLAFWFIGGYVLGLPAIDPLTALATAMLVVASYWMTRSGRVGAGLTLLLPVLLFLGASPSLQTGDLEVESLLGLTMVVVAVGLIAGRRGAWVSAIAALAVSLFAEWVPLDWAAADVTLSGSLPSRIAAACIAFFGSAAMIELGHSRLRDSHREVTRHQLELERRARELEVSQQRLQLLTDNAEDLIVEHSSEGEIFYVSPSFAKPAGPAVREVTFDEAGAMHEAGIDGLKAMVRSFRTRGNEREGGLFQVPGSDGGARWVELKSRAYQTLTGHKRWVSIGRDVTERVEAQNELERRVKERTASLEKALEDLREEVSERRLAQENLRRARQLASLGTLAGGIAHEINNPVGSILATAEYAQAVNDEATGREEVATSLKNIVSEAQRCGRIVKSVLAFAHGSSGSYQAGDLNEVVRNAATRVRDEVSACNAELSLTLVTGLAPLVMNAEEIERAVYELVRNALHSVEAGASVEIETRAVYGALQVTVRDNGAGISHDNQRRVFEPFFTTRQRDGGVGLGLSLVHGIVEAHGGVIHLRSAAGLGTDFQLEFPIRVERS